MVTVVRLVSADIREQVVQVVPAGTVVILVRLVSAGTLELADDLVILASVDILVIPEPADCQVTVVCPVSVDTAVILVSADIRVIPEPAVPVVIQDTVERADTPAW